MTSPNHAGSGFWRHATASSVGSEESRLRAVTWEQAQPWCNFVVLRPRDLPPGLSVENLTLRPEAPPGRTSEVAGRPDWHDHNRCSLRFEIVGGGRLLRVKQFLYDWDDGFPGEDMLRVNVWTPAVGDSKKRPVLVWIHGGGYASGSSQELSTISRHPIRWTVRDLRLAN